MDKRNGQPLSFASLALALSSDYCQLFVIDPEDDSYVEYAPSGMEKNLLQVSSGRNFFEDLPKNCLEQVWGEDQEMFLEKFKRERVMQALNDDLSFSFTYRLNIAGKPRYFFLKVIRAVDNSIIIGVRDIDTQKRKALEAEAASRKYSEIAQSLASMYEIIFHVDLKTGHYTEYSSAESFLNQGFGIEGEDFFSRSKTNIMRVVHPDDRQKILDAIDSGDFINSVRSTGSLSLRYRQVIDGKEKYMNMLVFMQDKETDHMVIGIQNVDKKVRREMSLNAEKQTFSDISKALAQEYEVIYYVNIVTNEYSEYSASEKYSKLKVGTKGEDFFEATQINMRHDIYKDDLAKMEVAMRKENLLNSLAASGKTVIGYRLMIDGRPQYVSLYAVRPKEDSDHIIIAVANVDEAKKMEIAYNNAMDMANRDALTGVKNKRAYVQAESELDEQIEQSGNTPFAVVVCDVNGLKQINDTLGHKAGDEYIRDACFIICNIFKHSPVFRIGGDEFAVLLRGNDYTNRNELMKSFHEVIEEHKTNGVVILAAGISEFDYKKDIRVQDVFERADNYMYADKEICKAQIR